MAEQPVLGFGGLLRQLRARARLTQEELGEAAGLSPRSVSDLERGINRTARKDSAELLAGALGLAEPARGLFVAAARGRAPAAEVLAALRGQAAPGSGPVWAGCPYLGLVPFEERDARVFYGRGELTDQLVQKLAARLAGTGILLVTGESGTGKSSLLRAGLMPRLAAGALGLGSERWPRRVIRPAGSPLRELATQLAELASVDPVSVYRSLSAAPGEAPTLAELAVRTVTGRGARARSRGPAEAAAAAPPRLILVVDQFEELFTAGEDTEAGRAEREAFIVALHAVATCPAGPRKLPPALVVAAVRADFLGRLIAYPPLKAALDAGLFTVGPMSEAELRLAITGPAAEADLAVEPALVEAVIAELREGTGAGLGSGVLPLMSQAMAATWERREGSELTLRAYRRAGGVADVVNRSAQAAYDTLTSAQKDAARLVFTQLTVITPDGQFARRQCSESDLHAPGTQTRRPRRGDRHLQRPPPARPRKEQRRDRPRRAVAGLEAAPGLARRRPARPCPVQPGRHRRGHLGEQPPGLLLPVPAGTACHHRRDRHSLAGRAHPIPPAPGHQQGVPWRRSPRRAPQRPTTARRLRDPGPADRAGRGGSGRGLVSAGGCGPAT